MLLGSLCNVYHVHAAVRVFDHTCVAMSRCWQPMKYQRGRGRCLHLYSAAGLYNKQCAVQIKVMAISDTGLHIVSAAKVRAESMNVLVEAGRAPPPELCGSIKL